MTQKRLSASLELGSINVGSLLDDMVDDDFMHELDDTEERMGVVDEDPQATQPPAHVELAAYANQPDYDPRGQQNNSELPLVSGAGGSALGRAGDAMMMGVSATIGMDTASSGNAVPLHDPYRDPIASRPTATSAITAMDTEFLNIDDIINDGQRQRTLDDAVELCLMPDMYRIRDADERRQHLQRDMHQVATWAPEEIDASIIKVADAMSEIEKSEMVDCRIGENFEEPELRAKYALKKIDLTGVKAIDPSYFTGGSQAIVGALTQLDMDLDDDKEDSVNMDVTVADMALEIQSSKTGHVSTTRRLRIGKGQDDLDGGKKILCAGCGQRCRFRAKSFQTDNFLAYRCPENREKDAYIFHNYLCVRLRKIKEKIREYVFHKETENVRGVLSKEDRDAAFLQIDIEENAKRSNWAKPQCPFTTPPAGDHNYGALREAVPEAKSKKPWEQDLKPKESDGPPATHRQQSINLSGGYAGVMFRKYRGHVKLVLERLENKKKKIGERLYSERFIELPKELLYCDLNEYGTPIWEFVSDSLKSKQRQALWQILEFLALEIGTNTVLDFLKRHTHLLSKHSMPNFDAVCKACMEGSKYPIATALRLAAFMKSRAKADLSNEREYRMKGDSYVMIARKLLKEIESDHLFALLLQIPTEIDHCTTVELALKYDLIAFLEEPRIVRMFGVLWKGGFDFLDPDTSFQETEGDLDELYRFIWDTPGQFFFSPQGKFYVTAILYISYLCLFSLVTYMRIYNYTVSFAMYEYLMWGSSLGYVAYEAIECYDDVKEYFSSATNFFDILIAIDWVILAYLRFLDSPTIKYNTSGQLDQTATRNTTKTEIYMAVWAFQCIVLWARVTALFQISRSAGPLIRMISNMIRDVINFGLICGLFLIGITFASYYIIGQDLSDVSGVRLGTITNVGQYIFQTILGQQDWDKIDSAKDTDGTYLFDPIRSNMVIGLMILFSIFGTVLLLNLLIAMMASSYSSVKDRSNMELNKQIIKNTFDLDKSRAIMPPPLNMVAFLFYVYWVAFEFISYVLTFGHRQFNEEFFSPLNKGKTQYQVGDRVTFEKGEYKLKGTVVRKMPVADRLKGGLGRRPTHAPENPNDDEENLTELGVEYRGEEWDVQEAVVLKTSKRFFKRRIDRVPSVEKENYFCRFCRYNLTGDRMDIQYYLSLFEKKGQHIDPEDKQFIEDLLRNKDQFGIVAPQTMDMCPNCYRPYKVFPDGTKDLLTRDLFVLEIVSYLTFKLVVWPPMVILLFLPAKWRQLVKAVTKRVEMAANKDASSKKDTLMFRTENNDDYRAKVRKASVMEEGVQQVIKRIDDNMFKMEQMLMGSRPKRSLEERKEAEEDDDEEDIEKDEFDLKLEEIQNYLNKEFDEVKTLLKKNEEVDDEFE